MSHELRSVTEWRALARRHGVRPDKRLGQHFLLDPITLRKIVTAVDLQPGEVVVEIGAGMGTLTCALAQRAPAVYAIEIDHRLEAPLSDAVQGLSNVRVLAADVMAVDLDQLVGEAPHAVVGNIPYNITSAVIRKLMEAQRPARRVVLTIQDEVARRITSQAGEMSLLALSVQLYGDPKIVLKIPGGQFWPVPEVDSAVIRIDTSTAIRRPPERIDRLFTLARAGFGQRRKQLKNALSIGLSVPSGTAAAWLDAAGIEPTRRAQSLSVDEWEHLEAAATEDLPPR